jgi:hypothetical protein
MPAHCAPAFYLGGAHAGLAARGLGDSEFSETVRLLAETLAGHGASEEAISEVGEWAESVRAEVLNLPLA